MSVSRRQFIGGAVSFGALQGCRVLSGGDAPRLVFGVISDIHVIAENTDFGGRGNTRTLKQALRWFDFQGVDGVVIAGDLADGGLVSQLQCVADAWNEVFPLGRSARDGRSVEKLFIYGNHDFEGHQYGYSIFGRNSKELVADQIVHTGLGKVWEEVFGEEYAPIYKKVVKGYSFVGAHWDPANGSDWGRGPDIAPFFAAHEGEIDPTRPFFYIQHPVLKGTCYGSWARGSMDAGKATEVLSSFPNAIAFSGHSHYPLLDERGIWQGAFASVGAGSLRFAGCPYEECDEIGGFENSGGTEKNRRGSAKLMDFIPNTADARNGLLVTVYDDRVVFRRRDFQWDVDLGPDWVLPLAAESKPFAFAEHSKRSAVPQFPAGAKLDVVRDRHWKPTGRGGNREVKEIDVFNLTVPCAAQTFEGRVWEYVVTAKVGAKTVLERRVLSPDYHLPLECAQKSFVLPVPAADLPRGGGFRFEVTPRNCFGKAGRPLTNCVSS